MHTVREIVWRRVMDDRSFELARLTKRTDGPVIEGTVIVAEAGLPMRIEYRITCDPDWRTRRVDVSRSHDGQRRIMRLDHDGTGTWTRDGTHDPALDGCTDVDLGISPSTNALPVNRLALEVGAAASIRAAWVLFPSLEVVAAGQSYERLEERRYRYRSMTSSFTAEIEVDADGMAVDYAGIWRRIADGPACPA